MAKMTAYITQCSVRDPYFQPTPKSAENFLKTSNAFIDAI